MTQHSTAFEIERPVPAGEAVREPAARPAGNALPAAAPPAAKSSIFARC